MEGEIVVLIVFGFDNVGEDGREILVFCFDWLVVCDFFLVLFFF